MLNFSNVYIYFSYMKKKWWVRKPRVYFQLIPCSYNSRKTLTGMSCDQIFPFLIARSYRAIQKVLVPAPHDACTSSCDHFWIGLNKHSYDALAITCDHPAILIIDRLQEHACSVVNNLLLSDNYTKFLSCDPKNFPLIVQALVRCSCDHPAILIVDRLQERAQSVVNDL